MLIEGIFPEFVCNAAFLLKHNIGDKMLNAQSTAAQQLQANQEWVKTWPLVCEFTESFVPFHTSAHLLLILLLSLI